MDYQQAWRTVLGQLQMEMPRASYDTWVRDTEALSYDDGVLTVGVRNAYARDWLESRLASTVSRLLIGIMNRTVDVSFMVVSSEATDLHDNDDDEANELESDVGQSQSEGAAAITAISLEDHKLMDRVVVLPGYMQRLVQDVGVKGVWLYAAHKQAYFMAGSSEERGGVTRRVGADDIVKWAIFAKRAYWRNLKQKLPLLGGLLERVGDGEIRTQVYRRDGQTLRRRLANEYRLYLTPRLARADSVFLFHALKDAKSVEAGLKQLSRMSRKDLIGLLPLLGAEPLKVDGLENMGFVADIVRALTGEEGDLSEPLEQLSNKLHLKVIKLWGTMHLSHYFLYRLIPEQHLTAHQAWFLAVARDRAYINSQTGEMRSEIRFAGGYEEMATICEMASWKGVAAWLRPYENKRGGNLFPFIQEIDSPDDKSFGKIGELERYFTVQLDDENLFLSESSDTLLEESNDTLLEESSDTLGESNDTFLEESSDTFGNSAPLKVLKENTLNTKKKQHIKPPPTRRPASRFKAGSGGADISSPGWDINLLLKLNPGEKPIVRKRIKTTSDPSALVSWLLYAYSAEGEGIRSPSVFALSKLKNDPDGFAPGVYKNLAKLGPAHLREKIQGQVSSDLDRVERFLEGRKDTSGWAKVFGSVNDEIISELESRLFDK